MRFLYTLFQLSQALRLLHLHVEILTTLFEYDPLHLRLYEEKATVNAADDDEMMGKVSTHKKVKVTHTTGALYVLLHLLNFD